MGLQVWLPLNGDLRNNGLTNATITNSGATINDNGKFGKCYSFDGTNDKIQISNAPTPSDVSVAMWFKRNATTNTRQFLYTQWQGITLELDTANKVTCSVYSNGSQCGYCRSNDTITVDSGWVHICFVFKNGTGTKLYINGSQISYATLSTPIAWNSTTGNIGYFSTYLNACVNDFRIYDHALSLKEIKEISKGLVLHYPLSKSGFGNDNLLINTHFDTRYSQTTGWDTTKNGTLLANSWGGYNSGVNNQGTVYHAHLKEVNNEYVYEYIKTASESWLGISQGGLQSKLVAGNTYTFSWEQYCVEGNNYSHGGLYYYKTGASSASFHIGSFSGNSGRVLNKWQKYTYTFTAPSDGDYSKNMSWYIYGMSGGNGIMYLKRFKLEEGSKATSWCPNSSDKLTTILGLNNNEVYDCSGFENNGTRVGTFSWTENTPRYNTSTVFNGVDNAIQTPSLPTMITDKNYTISVWTYKDSIGSKSYQTIYGGQSGFELEARNSGGTSPQYVGWNWGKPVANYEFSKWNHFCFVHSDADCKLYVNGEYISSGTAKDSNPAGNYFIGAWKTSGQQNYEGLMSDFRIYATALSADDVKLLYQVTTSADKNNNYYLYSYDELTQNREIEHLYDTQKSSGSGTFTQDKNGLHMNGNIWIYHDYIPINPTGKTYKYDITYSCDAGNQFYIGWERYDANKTSRSNNACVYVVATKPSTDVVKNRVKGIISLSTDGVNPCAFIKLRILNKWTGSDSNTQGKATIHSLSLKEYSNTDVLTPLSHTKQGVVNTTAILENDIGVSINNTYELNSNNFYEI